MIKRLSVLEATFHAHLINFKRCTMNHVGLAVSNMWLPSEQQREDSFGGRWDGPFWLLLTLALENIHNPDAANPKEWLSLDLLIQVVLNFGRPPMETQPFTLLTELGVFNRIHTAEIPIPGRPHPSKGTHIRYAQRFGHSANSPGQVPRIALLEPWHSCDEVAASMRSKLNETAFQGNVNMLLKEGQFYTPVSLVYAIIPISPTMYSFPHPSVNV